MIPTEFSDSPYTISSGSDVSYGVHLDGDVYDLSSYIVGFSYGNIHSPYTDYTGYACFVNSYGSGDYDAWEESYGQADYWWLRSPDTDVNDDAYWVVSSGSVGFGDGVNYDSYGKNHSPSTGNSNSACNVHMSSRGGTFSMDRSYGIISLSASS